MNEYEFDEIEVMQTTRKAKKTAMVKPFRIPERMNYDLLNRADHMGHKVPAYIRWVLACHLYGVVRAAELGFEQPPTNTLEDDDEE